MVMTLLLASITYASFSQELSKFESKLFIELPDHCPTPDAYDISPDGLIALSCTNYADGTKPGAIIWMTSDGEIVQHTTIRHSDSTYVRPMGIAYGSDGSLYLCDNQGTDKGRIIRATFKNGVATTTEVVASGFNAPNGIRYRDGFLYVTQPKLPKINTDKLTSGVYRFSASDRDVKVNNDESDNQLIFTTITQNPDRQFGLDGIVFDKQGNLLVGDFGDGTIHKLKLDKKGRLKKAGVFAEFPNSAGIDGIYIDDKGDLYAAGFSANQIWRANSKGNIELLIEHDDNDGANGGIDQPSDLIVYQGKLIISNFDLMKAPGMKNSGHSRPYTLSYIELEE